MLQWLDAATGNVISGASINPKAVLLSESLDDWFARETREFEIWRGISRFVHRVQTSMGLASESMGPWRPLEGVRLSAGRVGEGYQSPKPLAASVL
jgi:hypothetical protein